MAVFNTAFANLCEIISSVEYEYEMAKKHCNEVRAVILLDKVPAILRDKGLSSGKSPTGSEDMRQAILDLDSNYSEAQNKIIDLKCTLSLLEGKKKSIEMAYTSVKKVYGDSSQYRHSQSLSLEPGIENPSSFFKHTKY
jgi:chromosome segregation ATPase